MTDLDNPPETIESREQLAAALTALRERAGLSVRDLAKASGLPLATVGGYVSGRHLPQVSALEQVRAMLLACGVTDPVGQEVWLAQISRLRRTARRTPGPAPYRGLASFDLGSAQWFFGREALVETLAQLVGERRPGLPVVVVGPSGSGKSSLIKAGLLPRQPEQHRCVVLSPGATPMDTLRSALEAGSPDLLVVDQVEECFTLCEDVDERRDFVDALGRLAGSSAVVLGLRSDFYSLAMTYPLLVESLQQAQLVVGPMSQAELTRAVLEPATRAGLTVEDGLLDQLLRDLAPRPSVAGGEAYEAGALPLLSHALLATWERGNRKTMASADYLAVGGIDGSVARTAEAAFTDFDPAEQALARSLFLRMVTVVDGSVITRRPLGAPDDPQFAAVVEVFVEARLMTADAQAVAIAHEALLTAWPRLRGWVEEALDELRLRRRLAEAVDLWTEHGKDPRQLYRGAPLELAAALGEGATGTASLSATEREFLQLSQGQETANRTAEVRRARVLRRLSLALSVLVILAISLAGVSWRASNLATDQRNLAMSRQLAGTSQQMRATDLALSRQLAVAAQDIAQTPEAVSALLSDTGLPRVSRLTGATGVVQSVAVSGAMAATVGEEHVVRLWDLEHRGPEVSPPLPTEPGTLFAVALNLDAHTLYAAGSTHTVYRWDVSEPASPKALDALDATSGTVYALAAQGSHVAAVSSEGLLRVWDAPAFTARSVQACEGVAQAVSLTSAGSTAAVGCEDGSVGLWDLTGPSSPTPLSKPVATGTGAVLSLAFSPDGATLAAGNKDQAVHLLDVSDPAEPTPAREPLTGPESWVNGVAWSPDGATLAAASSDTKLYSWSVPDWSAREPLPHPGPLTAVAFSPDGAALLSTSTDAVVRVWELPGPVSDAMQSSVFGLESLDDGRLVAASTRDEVAFWDVTGPGPRRVQTARAPKGAAKMTGAEGVGAAQRLLASGTVDGSVLLWDLAPDLTATFRTTLRAGSSLIETVAISNDGRLIAAGDDDNLVHVWDISDLAKPRTLASLKGFGNYVTSVDFTPDAKTLVAGSIDRSVRLWDVAGPGAPTPLGEALTGPTSYVYAVDVSPDGRVLAVGSDDKTVRLWDISDPAGPVALAVLTGADSLVYSLAFDPSGHRLVAGLGSGSARLWDVSAPAEPHALATLSGGSASLFAITFARGSDAVVASGSDHRIRVWGTDPQDAVREACRDIGASITPELWERYAPGVPRRTPCP